MRPGDECRGRCLFVVQTPRCAVLVVVDGEYEPFYSPRRAKGDGRDEGGLLHGWEHRVRVGRARSARVDERGRCASGW